jgi:hypothetical protein
MLSIQYVYERVNLFLSLCSFLLFLKAAAKVQLLFIPASFLQNKFYLFSRSCCQENLKGCCVLVAQNRKAKIVSFSLSVQIFFLDFFLSSYPLFLSEVMRSVCQCALFLNAGAKVTVISALPNF